MQVLLYFEKYFKYIIQIVWASVGGKAMVRGAA